MAKSYYIITAHNKEDLIVKVIEGIVSSHDQSYAGEILVVLDGCTDGTEALVDSLSIPLPIKKLYSADTHEITSLNTGIAYIRTHLDPCDTDLVFMLQDDVILKEDQINLKAEALFDQFPQLGYVSMRLGLDVSSDGNTLFEKNLVESEFGHWDQMGWTIHTSLKKGSMLFKEVVVRSPALIRWDRFKQVGVFDSALSPCGFDCHDMSIRMNEQGYQNAVVAFEYYSDVSKGTMRTNSSSKYNKKIDVIYERNRQYLARKHKNYFLKKTT